METKTEETKKTFRLAWWVWLMLIVAVLAIATILALKTTIGNTEANDTTKIPDTKEEITVKQHLSSLRGDIVRYHEKNQTYVGWSPNTNTIEQVKKMGSELKTQALTQDTYVIYAQMPNSKTFFCLDHNGFTSEVLKISLSARSCQ